MSVWSCVFGRAGQWLLGGIQAVLGQNQTKTNTLSLERDFSGNNRIEGCYSGKLCIAVTRRYWKIPTPKLVRCYFKKIAKGQMRWPEAPPREVRLVLGTGRAHPARSQGCFCTSLPCPSDFQSLKSVYLFHIVGFCSLYNHTFPTCLSN